MALDMIESHLRVIRDTRKVGELPKVSVIVPVYNVEHYVVDCLNSLLTAAHLIELEIIIVDDGSTDKSAKVILGLFKSSVQQQQVLFLHQDNKGLSAVRNIGVSLSRGEYICFLDSDDFILPEGLKTLCDYAQEFNCDIVMGRSMVFDSKNHKVWPFYDDWVWLRLLEGMDHRVVLNSNTLPLCFCLEPNANYRLCKRSFYLENNFHFPEGRVFEDLPVHLNMLAKAGRLGFVNVPYYWYRVNRPGKITSERSERRFDMISVAAEAIQNLKASQISDGQGGAALYSLFKIVWWCGMMCLPEHRPLFFKKACALFRLEVPKPWARTYFKQYAPDTEQLILGALFLYGSSQMLTQRTFENRNPLALLFFLINIGWIGMIVNLGNGYFKQAVNRILKMAAPRK